MAEFELFYQNVLQFTPVSLSAAAMCKATLESTVNDFITSPNDLESFYLGREHMKSLRELRQNCFGLLGLISAVQRLGKG